jgi:hypothetical protein
MFLEICYFVYVRLWFFCLCHPPPPACGEPMRADYSDEQTGTASSAGASTSGSSGTRAEIYNLRSENEELQAQLARAEARLETEVSALHQQVAQLATAPQIPVPHRQPQGGSMHDSAMAVASASPDHVAESTSGTQTPPSHTCSNQKASYI